jgi:hypothetical protein
VANVVASGAKTASIVTITDLENGETIDIGSGTSTSPAALGTATSVAAATSLETALDLLSAATAQTVWSQYAGNTYIFWDATSSGTVTANGDIITKLSGEYDLSLSTIDANDIITYVEVV